MRTEGLTIISALMLGLLTLTSTLPVNTSAATGGAYVFFTEEVEEPTFDEWHVRWHKTDQNPDSSLDTWCRQMHKAHSGTHAAWCSRQGYNTHYINGTGLRPYNGNITSLQPPVDPTKLVLRYDTNMDAIMRRELVGASYYDTITMSFWFYSDTGRSDARQPDGGTYVGYDFLNVIYYTSNNGVLSKHVLWTNTYEQATAKKWLQESVTIPSEATWVGFEFVSGTVPPQGGDDADAFAAYNIRTTPEGSTGMKEGVYIDDVVVTGFGPSDDVPLFTHVDPLPVYEQVKNFTISWSHNDPEIAKLQYVDLYYRITGTEQWTKYANVQNPQGRFTSSPITFNAIQDGNYEFFTQGHDINGGAEVWRGVADTWTVLDGTPPVSSIDISGNLRNGAYSGSATFTLSGTDAASGIDHISYRVDGSEWTNYSGMVGVNIDGKHLVEYFAVDKMGNNEPIRKATITIVDGVPGVVFQNSGEHSSDGNITIRFTVTSTAPIIELEYSLDGGDYVSIDANATSVSLGGLEDGEHALTVRARDSSGNVLINEAEFTVGMTSNSGLSPLYGDTAMLAIAGVVGAAALGGLALIGMRRRRG